jgi:hypothetical protein
VASQLVGAKLIPGSAVYGHWTGPIAKDSYFHRLGAGAGPFVRHGWILLPDERVCDPTRWVFEDVAPYLYVGEADHYDEGGDKFRVAMYGDRPPPAPQGELKPFEPEGIAHVWVRNQFRPWMKTRETLLADNQVFHLANMPYSSLKEAVGTRGVKHLYDTIAQRTHTAIAWIPVDNTERARRECGFNPDPYYEDK